MVNVLTIDRMGDVDPHGYLDEIEKGVEYLDSICQDEPEHGCVYWSNLAAVYTEVGMFEQATFAVERLLRCVQRHSGYEYYSSACMRMAVLQASLGKWHAVLELAEEGLVNPPKPSAHATLLIGRARALLHLGDPEAAATSFRESRNPLSSCEPSSLNYDFAAAYREESGDLHEAIRVRENQFRDTEGKGRHWERAKSGLELTRLYSLQGNQQASERWAQKTRRASSELREPEFVAAALEKIRH